LLLVVPPVFGGDSSLPVFEDIARAAGIDFIHINGEKNVKNYIFEAKGGGVGLFDYDNDGWLDIWVVQGSTVERFRRGDNLHGALFRNRQDGTFENVTEKAGLTATGWGMGVSFADYDNDGWCDIYLTNLTKNVLYRNLGNGKFEDVTDKAGVGDEHWSSSAGFGDYDGDGDLDLYVSNYITLDFENLPEPGSGGYCVYKGRPVMCGPRGLPGAPDTFFRNNGDGTFTDVTDSAGVADTDELFGLAVLWADIDNDHDLDLYVANDDGPNLLYLNRGDGTFEEMGFLTGLAVSMDGRNQGSMGVDIADYDNDGLMDAFLTHFASDYSTLYHNQGDLLFEDVSGQTPLMEAGWHMVSWGTRFIDLNLDGWKDIFYINGHVTPFLIDSETDEKYYQPAQAFLNQAGKGFIDVSKELGQDIQVGKAGRGAAFGDIDNDGDIDVLVANLNDTPSLFQNHRRDQNHWVMFKTVGHASNRDGIGARITLTAGGITQVWDIKRTVSIFSASDPRAHFGTGTADSIEKVQILWPSGKSQVFSNLKADRHYLIDEEKGVRKEFED
jgi:hypothetical protein